MRTDNVILKLYHDAIPEFAEAEMERLYHSLYSSLAHFHVYENIAGVSTCVIEDGSEVTGIFLIRIGKDSVRVLNEGISLDEQEIARFARFIFASFRGIRTISFHAVEANIQKLPFPYQRYSCTEDIVLDLPDSSAEYLARLGKSTRNYINRYLNKLKRTFPSVHHEVYVGADIREQDVRQIIALNRARMSEKHKESLIDENEAMRIFHLAQACGLLSVLTIDGRICAGLINYRVGDHYFLEVIAHDPAYNDYRLGTLCCYLTICECIARQGKAFHFQWGNNDYKYRLLGVRRELHQVTVYQSWLHFALNSGMVLRHASHAQARKAKAWMRQKALTQTLFGAVSRLTLRIAGRLWHIITSGMAAKH